MVKYVSLVRVLNLVFDFIQKLWAKRKKNMKTYEFSQILNSISHPLSDIRSSSVVRCINLPHGLRVTSLVSSIF